MELLNFYTLLLFTLTLFSFAFLQASSHPYPFPYPTDINGAVAEDTSSDKSTVGNAGEHSRKGQESKAVTSSDKPIRLDSTPDTASSDLLKIPPRRPYTPYDGGSREFTPARIIPSDTPCIYKKSVYFFHHAKQLKMKPADLLRRAIFRENGTDSYFYDPEDLCILIDDELNIDIYQFDCSQIDVCTCGRYFGYVDLNVPQPEPINQVIKYVAVNGLDRKLVEDQDLCVSGLTGHCTLLNSTSTEKLYCSSSLECVLDDSYGPILKNLATQETYGICLPKHPEVRPGDNFPLGYYISKRLIAAGE